MAIECAEQDSALDRLHIEMAQISSATSTEWSTASMSAILLESYGSNSTSQFGEDGMIAHVLETLGVEKGLCVEFGASDGIFCSNTWLLRQHGWASVLVEADRRLAAKLKRQVTDDEQDAHVVHALVAPTGPKCIDEILATNGFQGRTVDLMSIDVDGDDFYIFRGMQTRPRLVVIEFNCSVPAHLALVGKLGGRFGASLRAMDQMAQTKDYRLIGCSLTNAFFVRGEDADSFQEYEGRVDALFAERTFATVVSDYDGRSHLVQGHSLYWGFNGFKTPVSEPINDVEGALP